MVPLTGLADKMGRRIGGQLRGSPLRSIENAACHRWGARGRQKMPRDDEARRHSVREQQRREDAELDQLERDLEELRVAYDRYFLGLDKRPPETRRAAWERAVRKAKLADSTRAVIRFRFSNVRQRHAVLAAYWDRTMRKLEEGTLRRGPGLRAACRVPSTSPPGSADASSNSPLGTARARARDERGLRRVYDTFIRERARRGQPVDGLSWDRFVQTIRRQAQALGTDDIEVEVAERNGMVAVVPRRR